MVEFPASRLAAQLDGRGVEPELRVTILPRPTQKITARPVPRPASAPWWQQVRDGLGDNESLYSRFVT